MPDDRRGTPRLHLIAEQAADAARAHDQADRVLDVRRPGHREDDTVPLGRPPGVPDSTALEDRIRAALATFFASFSLTLPAITVSRDGTIVDLDVSARLTVREVARLEALVASLAPTGR